MIAFLNKHVKSENSVGHVSSTNCGWVSALEVPESPKFQGKKIQVPQIVHFSHLQHQQCVEKFIKVESLEMGTCLEWERGNFEKWHSSQLHHDQHLEICGRYAFLLHLIFLITDRIWSPSLDFGRQKHGQKCPAANFSQKGVCSPMYTGHFTFYDPSQ